MATSVVTKMSKHLERGSSWDDLVTESKTKKSLCCVHTPYLYDVKCLFHSERKQFSTSFGSSLICELEVICAYLHYLQFGPDRFVLTVH